MSALALNSRHSPLSVECSLCANREFRRVTATRTVANFIKKASRLMSGDGGKHNGQPCAVNVMPAA